MSNFPKEPIALRQDCPAVAIPAGRPTTLPKGTQVTVTQSLGGSFTVASAGGLFQIDGQHAAALNLEPPTPRAAPEPAGAPGAAIDENAVRDALKTCFDPEIPVNIVDLGLVYDMRLSDSPRGGRRVDVKMTLTAAGCGMGPSIAADAQRKLVALPGVAEANVEIVWEPRWNPAMISAEGRKKLGMD